MSAEIDNNVVREMDRIELERRSNRTDLVVVNALFLLFYTVWAYEYTIRSADYSGLPFLLLAELVSLTGLLAAANPYDNNKRKIAKWSSILFVTIAIVPVLLLALPLVMRVTVLTVGVVPLLNVVAFWRLPDPGRDYLAGTLPLAAKMSSEDLTA